MLETCNLEKIMNLFLHLTFAKLISRTKLIRKYQINEMPVLFPKSAARFVSYFSSEFNETIFIYFMLETITSEHNMH